MSGTESPMTTPFVPAASYNPSPDLVGWDLYSSPSPVVCYDGVFTTGVVWTATTEAWTYGICSSESTDTYMVTGCTENTMLYEDSITAHCDTDYGYSCFEFQIYPRDHAASSEATWQYTCAIYGDATTASLVSPLPTAYLSSALVTSTSRSSKSALPGATPRKSSQPTGSISSSSSDPDSSSSSSGISGGAIGGIVVGCVIGVAILLMLIFRKRLIACFSSGRNHGPGGSYAPPQIESVAYTDSSKSRPSEMPSEQNEIHEIGTSSARPAQRGTILELG